MTTVPTDLVPAGKAPRDRVWSAAFLEQRQKGSEEEDARQKAHGKTLGRGNHPVKGASSV